MGYTPLGAATGSIILSNNGELKIGGYTHYQLPIVKNDLSFNGADAVCIDNGGDSLTPTILNLTTLTRNDRSTIYLEGQRNKFGVNTGTYLEQINVANNAPVSDGHMVSPVYTSNEQFNINGTYAANYYTFLNYGATGTSGFSYAPFTVGGSITGGTTSNGIVASQADFTAIASTDIAGVITSVATASGGTTVKALMTTASITGTAL